MIKAHASFADDPVITPRNAKPNEPQMSVICHEAGAVELLVGEEQDQAEGVLPVLDIIGIPLRTEEDISMGTL